MIIIAVVPPFPGRDPIVSGLYDQALYKKLKAAGADATYWTTPGGGRGIPGGAGFDKVFDDFRVQTLQLDGNNHKSPILEFESGNRTGRSFSQSYV